MQETSVADIVALLTVLVLFWKTFFSKSDKQKLETENEKNRAETDKTEADMANTYEETLRKVLERTCILEDKLTKQEEKIAKSERKIIDLERDNKKLKIQLSKRDAIIDCLAVSYRSLAIKAMDAGVEDIEPEAPCFNLGDEDC